MSESNEDMVRMLAADAPGAPDLAFEIALAARIERRRFWRELAMVMSLAVASALLLAVLMPELQAVWQPSIAPAGNIAVAATLFVFCLLGQRWVAQRS